MRKILKEIERFYCKLIDYFFLTENFHKYQIKFLNAAGELVIGQFQRHQA